MNDLSPEARALLELANGEDAPTREDRVRVRRALATSLSAGVVSSSAMAAGASKSALGAAAGASGALAKSTVAIWLTAGVLAGLAGSTAVFVSTRAKAPSTASTPERNVARATTPAPLRAPAPAAAPESHEAAPTAAAVQVESPPVPTAPQIARTAANIAKGSPTRASTASSTNDAVHAAAPPPAAPLPAAPPVATSLGQETALLESARTALGRGDGPGALALLERHEREFPTGALLEERLAAKVLALCSLGRRDEAARAASRLLRMSPASPLRARVLDSCAYEH